MGERPEHRRARERTDTEQAALDDWARSEVARHQAHGCQPDATGCVEAGPAVADDQSELERRVLPSGGLGASPKQRAILDRLRRTAGTS